MPIYLESLRSNETYKNQEGATQEISVHSTADISQVTHFTKLGDIIYCVIGGVRFPLAQNIELPEFFPAYEECLEACYKELWAAGERAEYKPIILYQHNLQAAITKWRLMAQKDEAKDDSPTAQPKP